MVIGGYDAPLWVLRYINVAVYINHHKTISPGVYVLTELWA